MGPGVPSYKITKAGPQTQKSRSGGPKGVQDASNFITGGVIARQEAQSPHPVTGEPQTLGPSWLRARVKNLKAYKAQMACDD